MRRVCDGRLRARLHPLTERPRPWPCPQHEGVATTAAEAGTLLVSCIPMQARRRGLRDGPRVARTVRPCVGPSAPPPSSPCARNGRCITRLPARSLGMRAGRDGGGGIGERVRCIRLAPTLHTPPSRRDTALPPPPPDHDPSPAQRGKGTRRRHGDEEDGAAVRRGDAASKVHPGDEATRPRP